MSYCNECAEALREIAARDARIAELETERDHWKAEYTRQLLLATTCHVRAERALERQAELEADEQATGALITRQQALLRGVVDAIRGPHPDPLARWGVHDAPELAAALVARVTELDGVSAEADYAIGRLKASLRELAAAVEYDVGELDRSARVEDALDAAAGLLSLENDDV